MKILSFNNIPYQIYRHYTMITESHPLVSFSRQVESNIEFWTRQIGGVMFEYPLLIVSTKIDPNSKAHSYEIGRASTASSLTSKSANQQFFNSCLNLSPYSSTEFWLRMILSSLITKLSISRSNFFSKRKPHCIFKTYSKLIVAQNILIEGIE